MKYRQGYIALITVLIVSGVALAIAATVSLLGIGVEQSALSGSKGENALELAEGCAEDALLNSQQSSSYSGGNITRPEGTCIITVLKNGNNWTIIATSTQTDYNRTVQVNFNRTSGSPIAISSWQEIPPVPTPTPTPTLPAPLTPALANSSTFHSAKSASTFTTGNFTVSSNNNGYLLVEVLDYGVNSPFPSSVKWGSTSLTNIDSLGQNVYWNGVSGAGSVSVEVTLWVAKLGTNSGTNTFQITPDGESQAFDVIAESWYNVNQTAPFGTMSDGGTATGSPFSMTASSANGRIVVDIAGVYLGGTTLTNDASQTPVNEYSDTTNSGALGSSYKAATTNSTIMKWTTTGSNWGMEAIDLIGQ